MNNWTSEEGMYLAERIVNNAIDDIDVEEIKRRYDSESRFRSPSDWTGRMISVIAVMMSLFHLYTSAFGLLKEMWQRPIHLCFVLVLVFLLYPATSRSPRDRIPWYDYLWAAVGAFVTLYMVTQFYGPMLERAGMPNTLDLAVGLLGIIVVLEATRRVSNPVLPVIVIVFLAYCYFGRYAPSLFQHRGYNFYRIINHMYLGTEGIFGTPLAVSSTFVFMFILFGSIVEQTGLGRYIIDLSMALAGWSAGGPAKVAVVSSGIMGTISGSSVANVCTTGMFTIPLMKSVGYQPHFAGAVEAVASTGGQIMPPVMGAAAFLMAEFVGVPYLDIVKAAIIPAVLYFAGVWLGVHFEAKRKNLKGIPWEELPKAGKILRERGHLAIPIVVIIYLLVTGYTPMRAALFAIVLSIAASFLRRSTRMKPIEILKGLETGAKNILGVLVACASAGIIIGVVTKTGVGLKLASAILDFAGGLMLPTLFFTMITALLLGMGVPTTANYVITSTIAAPALLQMGVPVLAAHMFVFYFGIIADVTPPVALAAYAGSAISGGNPLQTGINASKLAIAAFIIPYIFVLSPVILMVNATPFTLSLALFTALCGMVALSSALIGHLVDDMKLSERVVLFLGGLLMIYPEAATDLAGLAILAGSVFLQRRRKKAART